MINQWIEWCTFFLDPSASSAQAGSQTSIEAKRNVYKMRKSAGSLILLRQGSQIPDQVAVNRRLIELDWHNA